MGSQPSKPANNQQPPAAIAPPKNAIIAATTATTTASSGGRSDRRKSTPRHTLVASSFQSIFPESAFFPSQSTYPPTYSPTTSHPHVPRPPIVVANIPGIPRVESTTFDSAASSPRTSPKRPRAEREVSRGSNSRSASPRIVTFSCPASPTRDNNVFFQPQQSEDGSSKLPESGRSPRTS